MAIFSEPRLESPRLKPWPRIDTTKLQRTDSYAQMSCMTPYTKSQVEEGASSKACIEEANSSIYLSCQQTSAQGTAMNGIIEDMTWFDMVRPCMTLELFCMSFLFPFCFWLRSLSLQVQRNARKLPSWLHPWTWTCQRQGTCGWHAGGLATFGNECELMHICNPTYTLCTYVHNYIVPTLYHSLFIYLFYWSIHLFFLCMVHMVYIHYKK